MREMKDSGIEWIGEIPVAWDTKPISSGFEEVNTKNKDNALSNALQFRFGTIIRKTSTWTEEEIAETYSKYTVVEPGTIMINGLNLEFDFITQRVAIVEEAGIITSAYMALFPREDVLSKYGCYLFKAYDYCMAFHALGRGLRKTLAFSELKKHPMLLPSINEQKRIISYLDDKCSQIDHIIEQQQSVIEKLKEYKLSVITEAVIKGLNPDVPMKDSGIEWIGMTPEHWSVCRFGKIAYVKSNLVNPEQYPQHVQVSPENIEKDTGRLLECVTVAESGVISSNHLFYKGQLLYSKIRPKLNKVTIAPFDGLCSADMYPIETDSDSRFVMYMMLSNYFLAQVALVTENRVKMPKINQSELSNIWIAVAPLDEQKLIAGFLDSKCAIINKTLDSKRDIIEKLNDYKKSLIYEAVTGKMEV